MVARPPVELKKICHIMDEPFSRINGHLAQWDRLGSITIYAACVKILVTSVLEKMIDYLHLGELDIGERRVVRHFEWIPTTDIIWQQSVVSKKRDKSICFVCTVVLYTDTSLLLCSKQKAMASAFKILLVLEREKQHTE